MWDHNSELPSLDELERGGPIDRSPKSYVLRCRACTKTTEDLERKFCAKCGNDSLDQVATRRNSDGTISLDIDWRKIETTRKSQAPQRLIKGGKHDNCTQYMEDQRMPHNRAAKVVQNALDDSPFAKHDTVSRSSQLGIKGDRTKGQR